MTAKTSGHINVTKLIAGNNSAFNKSHIIGKLPEVEY